MNQGIATPLVAGAVALSRLYLVGQDGRVLYAEDVGPFGFKPAELKEAIDRVLAGQN